MQLFIALTGLITASGAYLLHQFWRRSLAAPAEKPGDEQDAELRAA